MKLFQTNSGLGYQELAIYLALENNKYLCVHLNFTPEKDLLFGCCHAVGKIESNLENYELDPTDFKLEHAELTRVLGKMLDQNNLDVDFEKINSTILSMI